MLPIVRYPSFVEEFLPRLSGVFTKPQLKHFARYLTGLVVCENKTVTGINRSFMGEERPVSAQPLANRLQVERGEAGQG